MRKPPGRPGETTAQLGRQDLSQAARRFPVVKVVAGPGAGRVLRLQGEVVTVGRGDENDVVIEDLGVSRVHCKFLMSKGKVLLKDVGSTNGTFVDGKRVEQLVLEDGTLIVLGAQVKLRFSFLAEEENELEQRLYEGATLDVLTGILNRRAWLNHVREALQRNLAQGYCIAMVDLDFFKKINDSHGHPAGDAALVEFCRRTRGLGREVIAGRWGGEEFIFYLRNQTLDRAHRRMERLREEVAAVPFILGPAANVQVTISIGLSEARPGESNLDVAIGRADKALYRSKEAGRNRVTAHVEETPGVSQRRVQSRAQCRIPVWCQAGEETFAGLVVDIGTGGLNLTASHELRNGAEIEVRPQENPANAVRLSVRWQEGGSPAWRYGTSFLANLAELRKSWVSEALRNLKINSESARDRRVDWRVKASCAVKLEGAAGVYTANLLNLGAGGLSVESPLIPPLGQVLRLELAQLKASVRVVWNQAPRCGLAFLDLNDGQKKAIALLITQALASKRPQP